MTTRGEFSGEAFAVLPMPPVGTSWTVTGWFHWRSGPGPLVAEDRDDWQWGWVYDADGSVAWRLGGKERRLALPVASLQQRMIFLAVAKAEKQAVLWCDDTAIDIWDEVPRDATLSPGVLMKHAEGSAAQVTTYAGRLPYADLRGLFTFGLDVDL